MPRLKQRLARQAEPRRAELAAYPTALAWSSRGDRLAVAGDHGITGVAWGADPGAGVLRWAAAGERGQPLIGAL